MKLMARIALLLSAFMATAAIAKTDIWSVKSTFLNVREQATTSSPILYKIVKYFPLEVVGKKGVWRQVKDFEGDIGWVHSDYLSTAKTAIVTNEFANIRASSSISSEKVGKADYGDVFPVLSVKDKWVEIQMPDSKESAWIYKSLLWDIR